MELSDSMDRFAKPLLACQEADAYIAFAALAEADTWRNHNISVAEQLVGERFGGPAGGYRQPAEEAACRCVGLPSNLRKRGEQGVAALLIGRYQLVHTLLRAG